MNEAVPRNRRLPAAAIAVMTILAMLLAPFCGSLCATSNGCAAAAAISESEAGDCHHAAMAGKTDAQQTAIAAAKTCNRAELPAVTLNATNSWSLLREMRGSTPHPYAIPANELYASSFAASRARWPGSSGDAVRSRHATSNTTVLQI